MLEELHAASLPRLTASAAGAGPARVPDGQLDRGVSDGLICDLFLNSVVAPAMYRHRSAAAGDGGDVGTAAIMERLAAELEEYVYLAAAFAGRDGALYRMVCMGNNLAAIAGEASSSSSCSSARARGERAGAANSTAASPVSVGGVNSGLVHSFPEPYSLRIVLVIAVCVHIRCPSATTTIRIPRPRPTLSNSGA